MQHVTHCALFYTVFFLNMKHLIKRYINFSYKLQSPLFIGYRLGMFGVILLHVTLG